MLPVDAITTGSRDLAICRAGTWLEFAADAATTGDDRLAISALERWRAVPPNYAAAGTPGGDTRWPAADGDVLVLERPEKSMYLLYRQDGRLRFTRVFRYVEP